MMKLTTVSHKTSTRSASIHWRTGEKSRGIVHVEIEFDSPDVEIICELVAIKYLIFEKAVFNTIPSLGKGYQLTVSRGAIRKILQGKTNKKHIIKFAAFIMADLKGVSLKVDHNMKDLPREGDEGIHVDNVFGDTEKYTNTHTLVKCPVLGDVFVTAHAVERYAERHQLAGNGEVKNPKISLMRRLQDMNLIKVTLPADILERKAKKHGDNEDVEYWTRSNTGIYFVIVNSKVGDTKKRTLVTTYIKN